MLVGFHSNLKMYLKTALKLLFINFIKSGDSDYEI